MTEEKRRSMSRARLADAMIEDMMSMSDDEILAELKTDGVDPIKNVEEMRAVFEHSLLIANKDRMRTAKASLLAARETSRRSISPSPEMARRRLHQALAACPPGTKMTLAARKENELSDADVISMLEDLQELGLIKDTAADGDA